MQDVFAGAERVLAAVGGLALFALNDVRMFQWLPRAADPGDGRVHSVALMLWGASDQVYVTALDLGLRWGLAGLTFGLCLWAVLETLRPGVGKTGRPQDL
jgi:hypothetical protein